MAGAYYNVDEIVFAARNLTINYPSLCRSIPLPNVTSQGRSCSALHLSSGFGHPKGTVLVLAGTHGREWGGAEIALAFAADLLRAYGSHRGLSYGLKTFSRSQVRALLRDMDVVLVPLVNPDGLDYSHAHDGATVDGWRKNRNATPGGIGVDVNRNFKFLWDFRTTMTADVWTSDDPHDEMFFGTAPFSEAESKNVEFLLDAVPDIRWLVDLHSASESILYSWGDAPDAAADPNMNFRNPLWDGKRGDSLTGYSEYMPADDLATAVALSNEMQAAIAAVRGKSYTVQPSFNLYPVSGTADDYAYSRFWATCAPKVQPFVIEFGKQFRPPWSEMELIVGDISAALFAFCGAARQRSRVPSSC